MSRIRLWAQLQFIHLTPNIQLLIVATIELFTEEIWFVKLTKIVQTFSNMNE